MMRLAPCGPVGYLQSHALKSTGTGGVREALEINSTVTVPSLWKKDKGKCGLVLVGAGDQVSSLQHSKRDPERERERQAEAQTEGHTGLEMKCTRQ